MAQSLDSNISNLIAPILWIYKLSHSNEKSQSLWLYKTSLSPHKASNFFLLLIFFKTSDQIRSSQTKVQTSKTTRIVIWLKFLPFTFDVQSVWFLHGIDNFCQLFQGFVIDFFLTHHQSWCLKSPDIGLKSFDQIQVHIPWTYLDLVPMSLIDPLNYYFLQYILAWSIIFLSDLIMIEGSKSLPSLIRLLCEVSEII